MVSKPESTEDPQPAQPDLGEAWQDPYSKDTLLSPELIALLRSKVVHHTDADKKAAELREQGYKTPTEAIAEIGLSAGAFFSRTDKIDPLKDYLLDGRKPQGTTGEVTVKGDLIKWKHPTNNKILLLHPAYVQGQANAEKFAAELRQQGYKNYEEAAEICGVPYSAISVRARQLDPDTDYLPDGSTPRRLPGQEVLKGSEIRWTNPYNFQNVLLHPAFVEALAVVAAQEKSYRDMGYIPLSEAAAQIGINNTTLQARTYQIKPEENYLTDGTAPRNVSDETVVKGALLCWRNPHNQNSVLLHPEYVRGQVIAEAKKRQLIADGYQTLAQVAKDTGINASNLQSKTKHALKPDAHYLPDGSAPTGEPHENTLKGEEIRWTHPYASTQVLLHPAYVTKLTKSTTKEEELRAEGYKTAQDVEVETGIKIPSARIGRIKAKSNYLPDGQDVPENYTGTTVSGGTIKWIDPNNTQKILLHPNFIAGHVQAEKHLVELQQSGFQTISEAAKEIGIAPAVVTDRVAQLANDEIYGMDGLLPKGVPEERTAKGDCLKWTHPYNWHTILLHPEYVRAQKQAEEQFRVMKKAGYEPMMAAAKYIGIEPNTLGARMRQIDPEGNYLINGTKPKDATHAEIVKGSIIKWTHPYNSQIILLHPQYIATHAAAEQEASNLLAPTSETPEAGIEFELGQRGYKTTTEAAATIGISVVALSKRAAKINANDEYLPNGTTPPKGNKAITIKGSTIRWVHPHKKNYILLSPAYIEAQVVAEAHEKDLLGRGYKTYNKAQEITGLDAHAVLQSRVRKIDSNKDYSLDGSQPRVGEPVVNGNELVWKHPYSTNVLIHPRLVEGWRDAEATRKELLGKKWLSIRETAEGMGANYMLVYKRATKIDPDRDYNLNGLPPQAGEPVVKGSALVWQHPYSRDEEGGIFVSPILFNAWKAADQQQQQLREHGYKTYAEAAALTGIDRSALEARVSKIVADGQGQISQEAAGAITLPSTSLVWKSPYGGALLHPDLVNHWERTKGKVAKGAFAEKIGESARLPADVEQELEKMDRENTPKRGG